MKMQLLLMAVKMLGKVLTPELMAEARKKIMEKIEVYVAGTANSVDDFIYKAVIKGGDELKVVADSILDFCEDYVLGSASKIDDILVLPPCKLIRVTFDIPDDD